MTTPPEPPVEPPVPPEPSAQPPADDLGALVERLSQFDPAEIGRRLEQLEDKLTGAEPPAIDLVGSIRDALAGPLGELGNTLSETREALKQLLAGGGGDRPPDPSPQPPGAKPQGGILDRLFDAPRLP